MHISGSAVSLNKLFVGIDNSFYGKYSRYKRNVLHYLVMTRPNLPIQLMSDAGDGLVEQNSSSNFGCGQELEFRLGSENETIG